MFKGQIETKIELGTNWPAFSKRLKNSGRRGAQPERPKRLCRELESML